MPQGYDDDYDGVPNTADDLAIRKAMKGGALGPNYSQHPKGQAEVFTREGSPDPGQLPREGESEYPVNVDEYMAVPNKSPWLRQSMDAYEKLSPMMGRGPEGFGGDSSIMMLEKFVQTPEGAAALQSGDPEMLMQAFERWGAQDEVAPESIFRSIQR